VGLARFWVFVPPVLLAMAGLAFALMEEDRFLSVRPPLGCGIETSAALPVRSAGDASKAGKEVSDAVVGMRRWGKVW
jgi:hypothetical protein